MYSKIINPKTNKLVNVNSKIGKGILNKYITILDGGFQGARLDTVAMTPAQALARQADAQGLTRAQFEQVLRDRKVGELALQAAAAPVAPPTPAAAALLDLAEDPYPLRRQAPAGWSEERKKRWRAREAARVYEAEEAAERDAFDKAEAEAVRRAWADGSQVSDWHVNHPEKEKKEEDFDWDKEFDLTR